MRVAVEGGGVGLQTPNSDLGRNLQRKADIKTARETKEGTKKKVISVVFCCFLSAGCPASPAAAPPPLRSVQVKESSPPRHHPSSRGFPERTSSTSTAANVGISSETPGWENFHKEPQKKAKSQKSQKKANLPSVFSPFPPASTSSLLVLRLLLRLPCVDTMPPRPPPSEKKQKKNEPSCEPVSERASAPRVQVSSERESRLELRASESCVCVCGALFGIFCVLCDACARARARVCLYFLARLRVT